MENVQFIFFSPNTRLNEPGFALITADHPTEDKESFNKLNTLIKKILFEAENLISSIEFTKGPINSGKWEFLKWKINCNGDPLKEGKFSLKDLNLQEIFWIAADIILKNKKNLFC